MFLSKDIVEAFAVKRNPNLNFPFLKENGELLQIAANCQTLVEPSALDLYTPFYDKSQDLIKLYPQFFRFILGITADLERLGYSGTMGKQIAYQALADRILDFDTSDTRRLEMVSLFQRLGLENEPIKQCEQSVIENIEKFTSDPKRFIYLNKPFFYELTHIIFFLTEFGNKHIRFNTDLVSCLKYAGVLCHLDEDYDLLAEICISLRYLSAPVPLHWEDDVLNYASQIQVTFGTDMKSALNASVDDYHIYFVCNWLADVKGEPSFQIKPGRQAPNFIAPASSKSFLSHLSSMVHNEKILGNRISGYDEILQSSLLQKNLTCELTTEETFEIVTALSQGLIDIEGSSVDASIKKLSFIPNQPSAGLHINT